MKQLHALALIMVIGLVSAGCAVSTKPLVKEDLLKRIASDREAMYKDQEPLKAPITLEEAMARSIKYNLDHRLKIMEDALALRQVDLMTYDLLPRLVAAAGYTMRDTVNASSSTNVFTGVQSLAPSYSQDREHSNADLTLTWNILDFGVSYFQAKQQADRAHIMSERRRKVVHTIMQQVRQAYWLALGAQQLEGRFEPLLRDVEKALRDSTNAEQEKLRPPIETLTYRKTLLEIIKQLEVFRDELAQAKPRLASLMNLPLDQSFTLVSPGRLESLDLTDKLDHMELQALLMRPELVEADYNDRISVYETRKAIARMLPGIEFTVGGHFDTNSFLVYQKWAEGGARLTWNLLNLISGPSQYKIAKSQTEIAQAQRLALSMAILTQVHVAYQDFYSRKRQYELSEQLQDVDTRIHEQTMNQAKSGAQNHLNEIRSATAALMAEYRSYQNYASLQNACGQIIATIGEDPLPDTVTSHEIGALAQAIGAQMNGPAAHCIPIPNAPPPAPIAEAKALPAVPSSSLKPVPESIVQGESATLDWVTQNATLCTLEPGIGQVALAGTRKVEPAKTTQYTLSCSGEGGTTTSTATVSVSTAAAPVAAAPVAPVVPPAVEAAPVIAAAEPNASAAASCSPAVLSVQFDTAKSDIKPQYHEELKHLAEFLKQFPQATGEISGHTDNAGTEKFNKQLSLERAQSVRTYLVKNFGIDPKRIAIKGYGPSKPIADNKTEEGKTKNRRIETDFNCEPVSQGKPGALAVDASASAKAETAAPSAEAAPQSAPTPDLQEALQRLDADLRKLPKKSPQLERYAKSARAGNAKALVALGWFYRRGIDVPADMAQALTWYRLSALQGNLEAQLALGWLFASGEGVEKNADEAILWYKKAAAQGSGKAKTMLKKLEK
jgi:outer membrane protein OmpA-like peptidoglycan-associated protein/outer membrane protein TolC